VARSRVLQTIYADGMTYVSVFIEPYKENHRPTHAAVGATQTLSMRQGRLVDHGDR
jgi:sigma-E factor negative regulatory protein RseB